MLGEEIWTCVQRVRERKETGSAWKKRTTTEMLLERRISWLCRISFLEVGAGRQKDWFRSGDWRCTVGNSLDG